MLGLLEFSAQAGDIVAMHFKLPRPLQNPWIASDKLCAAMIWMGIADWHDMRPLLAHRESYRIRVGVGN